MSTHNLTSFSLERLYELILLVGELGLVNVASNSLRCLATGHVVGGGSTLLAHLHIPLVPQLLSPRLPSLAPPCIAITPSPPSTQVNCRSRRSETHSKLAVKKTDTQSITKRVA
jgi:hypothetical protein